MVPIVRKKSTLWLIWLALTAVLGLVLGSALYGRDQQLFLPGKTTHGHYQIEQACDVCHTPFDGVKQESCLKCHGAELVQIEDSHASKKFKDPRNAPLLDTIDVRACVTCHGEHRQHVTDSLGVTLPTDFCAYCHKDVAKNRPSHKNLPLDGCRGCHNYHDNRALNEDYLAKHLHEPDTLGSAQARLPSRNYLQFYRDKANHPVQSLKISQQNAPAGVDLSPAHDWERSRHANAGVNCMACHSKPEHPEWTAKPDQSYCEQCHNEEIKGFMEGRHGMRLALKMSAMTTTQARLPMQPSPKTVTCSACHKAHADDSVLDAVDKCLGCHADEHSLAYKTSPHFRLLNEANKGLRNVNEGVSCATCHLPRETRRHEGKEQVIVQHNQNHNLRPNQKMARDVCLRCHGLGFSLDALADKTTISRNFTEKPGTHLRSLEMTEQHMSSKHPTIPSKEK